MAEKEQLKFKVLALANGDVYTDVIFNGNNKEFISKCEGEKYIEVIVQKSKVTINTDFIISYEV